MKCADPCATSRSACPQSKLEGCGNSLYYWLGRGEKRESSLRGSHKRGTLSFPFTPNQPPKAAHPRSRHVASSAWCSFGLSCMEDQRLLKHHPLAAPFEASEGNADRSPSTRDVRSLCAIAVSIFTNSGCEGRTNGRTSRSPQSIPCFPSEATHQLLSG